MTQPAKVQEPSMEEILASIRRIIADDEAKPAAAAPAPAAAAPKVEPAKPAAPAAKPPAMNSTPAATIPAAPPAVKPAPQPAPAPAKPAAPAAAAESNNQDDIDALLAGLDASTTPAEVRQAAVPEPDPEEDVFELTDDMALPDPAPPAFQTVESDADLEFAEAIRAERAQTPAWTMPAPAPVMERPAPPPYQPQQPQPPEILSRSTVSAVESAFNSLANTVLSNNARTLEDLVKEMLRPMLKSWLDDNLPQLVERIVKAEIERVSRGR
ncbi:MAG TPA: DUF2497 domain-containing protein [Rhodopseudomonas sp.]|uniref:PopZ family protein n=1 Tax=Rhodopseudomonas sp. TaxID=1078 RepID=UPI002ED8B9E4